MRIILLLTLIIPISSACIAETKKGKSKVQEVIFDDMDIKGNASTPDGAYLVQRRGLRFLPLHQVKQDFDNRIRESHIQMK